MNLCLHVDLATGGIWKKERGEYQKSGEKQVSAPASLEIDRPVCELV
jgi:hypothetical protein